MKARCFLHMLWKDSNSKKVHWNMIFLVLSGKMTFLFPKNMIAFFRRKMKDHISHISHISHFSFVIFLIGIDGISFSFKEDVPFLSNKER